MSEVIWFSNGTEGTAWMQAWCAHCAQDHEMHQPDGDGGCELILLAMDRQPIPEWTDRSSTEGFTLPPAIYCSRFTLCESCGDDKWARAARAPYVPDPCPVEGCRFDKMLGRDTCYQHRELTIEDAAVERHAKQVVREMLIGGLAQNGDDGIRAAAAEVITQIELELGQ
jgi:hypothetical protein